MAAPPVRVPDGRRGFFILSQKYCIQKVLFSPEQASCPVKRAICLALLIILCLPSTTSAAKRVALVIGNAAYHDSPLRNPVNDASDIAAKLQKLGFKVTLLKNADQRTMERQIGDFRQEFSQADIRLFYYAGHGMQVRGTNYLIPVNTKVKYEDDVKYEGVNAERILDSMAATGKGANIVILDACRNNPFARSFRSSTKGLARMPELDGSIIVYATSPGSIAADGHGRNGIFTEHFLKYIDTPGLTLDQVFKRTGKAVASATLNDQRPWLSVGLYDDIYLAGTPGTQQIPHAPAVESVPNTPQPSQNALAPAQSASSQLSPPSHDSLASITADPTFPKRSITNVVVWGAGGGTDTCNRIISTEMAKLLGQNINIVNKTGGMAGSVGMSYAYRQPHNGYTWCGLSDSCVTAGVMGGWKNKMDVWHPFIVGGSPDVISVTPSSPYRTIGELIETAKANPGAIKAGASGAGSIHYLNLMALQSGTGARFNFVPYRGSAPSQTAAMTGEITVVVTSLAEQQQLIRTGKLRPLGMLIPSSFPISGVGIIPSAFDSYPDLSRYLPISQAMGFALPKNTPPEILKAVDNAFQKALLTSKVRNWAKDNYYLLSGKSGKAARAEFAALEAKFAWALWELGATRVSPSSLGIPKP